MNKIPLKTINSEFVKNGLKYSFVCRQNQFCVYALEKLGVIIGYEVHKIRISKIPEMWSSVQEYEKMEKLASNEEFGRFGWSFQNKKNAMQKYEKLLKGGSNE